MLLIFCLIGWGVSLYFYEETGNDLFLYLTALTAALSVVHIGIDCYRGER